MTNLEHKIRTLDLISWIADRFNIKPVKDGYVWVDCKDRGKEYTHEELLTSYNRMDKKSNKIRKEFVQRMEENKVVIIQEKNPSFRDLYD